MRASTTAIFHPFPSIPTLPHVSLPGCAPLRTALSGGSAEASVHLTLYPLDALKTRLQHGAPRRRALYAGALPGVLGAFLDGFLFTTVYTRVKDGLQGRVPSGLQPLIAAAVATLASAGVEAPLALASLRAMVGVRSGVKLSGIYEGFVAALMRDVPKEAVAFATYEGLVGNEGAGGWRRAVCGVVAGGVAGFVTAPMDFAATRVVAEGGKAGPLLRRVLSGGGGDAFRGAPLRISREAVAAALFFVIYDALRLDEGEGEGQ